MFVSSVNRPIATAPDTRIGYLAFPPDSFPISSGSQVAVEQSEPTIPGVQDEDSQGRDFEEHVRIMDERRRVREARERDEALAGEKHWVRQGGMLRDANGRRDPRRTEEVRRIVEQEDKEQKIRDRWASYESAWARLTSSNDSVTFATMPWPIATTPNDPTRLRDSAAVASFLFESLSLAGITTTRKDRLRTSLLRWHPDKLSGIISRTVDDDRAAVKEGIDAVVISLRSLQEEERAK